MTYVMIADMNLGHTKWKGSENMIHLVPIDFPVLTPSAECLTPVFYCEVIIISY